MPVPVWCHDQEVFRGFCAVLARREPEILAGLERWLALVRVTPGAELGRPALRQMFAVAAVEARASELVEARGLSWEAARAEAGIELGVPEATAMDWHRRF